jgi:hypothetical protein
MAASAGNFSRNKTGRLVWLGLLVLMGALTGWWLAGRGTKRVTAKEGGPSRPAMGISERIPHEMSSVKRVVRDESPLPALRELAGRHETKPDAGEWEKLLGLLRQPLPESPSEEDRDVLDAVKARFAAHAGSAQVDDLVSVFHYASSAEAGQNALDVLGSLQSEDFHQRAREIVSDLSLATDDPVVTALARSLVRNGSASDLMLVLDRIDKGKSSNPSENNGMDGLMSAVHGALAEEMEPALCDAVSNRNRSHTWPSRLAAAAALQNHSTPASTRALTDAASNDPDPRVRSQAGESLSVLRTPEE